jgi:hypothetical protein
MAVITTLAKIMFLFGVGHIPTCAEFGYGPMQDSARRSVQS